MEINSLNISKPVIIEKYNEAKEEWLKYHSCRADVKTVVSSETVSSGAVQSTTETMFIVRYCNKTSLIEFDTELYRIKFRGAIFDLTSCDNDKYENKLIVMKGKGKRE